MRFLRSYKALLLCAALLIVFSLLNLLLRLEKWLLQYEKTQEREIPVRLETTEHKVDWHHYDQIRMESESEGPGEGGRALHLEPGEKISARNRKLFRLHGYDVTVSDRIARDRSVKDLRTPRCRRLKYRGDLTSVSIIIPFMEERLSALVRTFVTAYTRAPPHLIKEVILADDFSQDPSLGTPLDKIIAEYPKVRVLRMPRRMGAIRARQAAAENATADVLVFLDAHTEAGINWLPPLLDPIMENYRLVTCPFIDIIDAETFEITPQDGGARGAFSWYLNYKRLPVPGRGSQNEEAPFESPVMAGGLFVITRRWFFEFGGYDTGLDIWGGEQYDLSFKIWMCGGRMIDIPCSRFGHIFRSSKPFLTPGMSIDFLFRNYKRIIETWFDGYKEFAYLRQPELRNLEAGDLTEAESVRKRLKCKSFDWFMRKIAPDILDHYSLVPKDAAFGHVRCMRSPHLCLDFNNSKRPVLNQCKENDGVPGSSQNLILTWKGQITLLPNRNHCLSHSENISMVEPCDASVNIFQYWQYQAYNSQLVHPYPSIKCLECLKDTKTVALNDCDTSNLGQQWTWNHLDQRGLKELLQLP